MIVVKDERGVSADHAMGPGKKFCAQLAVHGFGLGAYRAGSNDPSSIARSPLVWWPTGSDRIHMLVPKRFVSGRG